MFHVEPRTNALSGGIVPRGTPMTTPWARGRRVSPGQSAPGPACGHRVPFLSRTYDAPKGVPFRRGSQRLAGSASPRPTSRWVPRTARRASSRRLPVPRGTPAELARCAQPPRVPFRTSTGSAEAAALPAPAVLLRRPAVQRPPELVAGPVPPRPGRTVSFTDPVATAVPAHGGRTAPAAPTIARQEGRPRPAADRAGRQPPRALVPREPS